MISAIDSAIRFQSMSAEYSCSLNKYTESFKEILFKNNQCVNRLPQLIQSKNDFSKISVYASQCLCMNSANCKKATPIIIRNKTKNYN